MSGDDRQLVSIRPERTSWPSDPSQRFEAIVEQLMVRVMELNVIATLALREEGAAATAIIAEPLEAVRATCADALGAINAACRRRQQYLDRQARLDAVLSA